MVIYAFVNLSLCIGVEISMKQKNFALKHLTKKQQKKDLINLTQNLSPGSGQMFHQT